MAVSIRLNMWHSGCFACGIRVLTKFWSLSLNQLVDNTGRLGKIWWLTTPVAMNGKLFEKTGCFPGGLSTFIRRATPRKSSGRKICPSFGSDPIRKEDAVWQYYRDVFLGESSFYFVLECNLSFSGRSHQHVRKCNNRLDVNKITKTVLHFRTEWYCRIALCPEM